MLLHVSIRDNLLTVQWGGGEGGGGGGGVNCLKKIELFLNHPVHLYYIALYEYIYTHK